MSSIELEGDTVSSSGVSSFNANLAVSVVAQRFSKVVFCAYSLVINR